ncbi:MAG: hypothetical protein WCA10_07125 [Terracidiphilus sp.]
MLRLFQCALWVTAGSLLVANPAGAQIRFGETSTSGTGTISSGYTANYGNMTPSSHGWTLGGAATLTGSFHSPNFLSYNVSPYLNQSRANSNFQSISDASGVNLSANIFAGSKFPGSITYSRAYNSDGNYAVPGLANFVTHGDSGVFGINWSENLPDAPSFSAGFQSGNSLYSVYGTNNDGKNTFHSLNLHSGYRWAGFNMGAYYTKGAAHSIIPPVLTATISDLQSDNTAYGYNLSHLLPWRGSFAGSINRASWNTTYLDTNSNGSIDTMNATAGVHPTAKLSVTATASYSDNLTGQIIQSVIGAGGVTPILNSDQSSNSLDLMTVATYTPLPNLQTAGFFERRTQTFQGQDYGVKSYGGDATFTHKLLEGTINSAVSITANSSDQSGQDSIGISASENYSNRILGWRLNESFSYAQNAQTLLVTYMNSYYNYSGNISRNWGLFNISAGGGGGRTALTDQAGTSNSSESYNAGIGYGTFLTATGSYSKADGQALATGAGLVGVPVPTPILPSDLVSLFGGKSYSFGVSSTPVKKLIFAATYAKSTSNTQSSGIASSNENTQYNALIQYQVRKLNFISGYARLEQGFSNSGSQPEVISSYYMGISRWFNFF